jgi:hypothetical protein
MSLDTELRQFFGRTREAAWPGEREAYDRFLRRRARRGRAVVAAAAGLTLAAILGAAVLMPRLLPEEPETAAPAATLVRVESEGFELLVPGGWKVERELMGARPQARSGAPGPAVVGVVLVPRSGKPEGAAITVTTDDSQTLFNLTMEAPSRRADGRRYQLRSAQGGVGQAVVVWPDFCPPRLGCTGYASPRVLLVTGSAAAGEAGQQQVLQVMQRILGTVRPITDSVRPAPPPTIPAKTKVLMGKGGSGRTAWEARIEPLDGNAGFGIHFPWVEERHPSQGWHWESLEPRYIQRDGTYTLMDCFSWVPGSGLLLSGLAKKETATVRFELAGQPPVEVATFGRDRDLPWVAYASPKLPAGSRVDRVVGLDAAGKVVGGEERPYDGQPLCGSR